MILTLQSTTFGAHGGIPTYNRCVCRVLEHFAGADDPTVLIATDDRAGVEQGSPKFGHIRFEGFGGKRGAFTARAMSLALRGRVDLALIGHVNYAPIGLALKKIRPRMRYGVMVHGVDVWSKLSPLKRKALQQADFITSVSEYTKQRIVEMNGVDPERVYLLPNTIDWEEDQIATEAQRHGENTIEKRKNAADSPGSNGKPVRLLSVCRLEASEGYKGVDHVIEALPEVLKVFPNVEYSIIGVGSDLERHKQLAVERGVGERVHFLGSVDAAQLRAAYRDCDVFVMPSAGEGFGIVFLEAMQCGKPVVAANSAATPEVVIDKVTGLLVEYGSREQISRALIDLCLDAEKRERLGAAGYQRLQENFTFPRFKERLTEILLRELPERSTNEVFGERAGASRPS